MLTGPDVSEHQGNVEWGKVSAGQELAIVRIADGDHRDPWYTEERVKAVRQAGLILAPYYFARVASPGNSQRDGKKEAAMALGFAKSRGWKWPGDLPLIYDFETNNAQPNDKAAQHVVQFVQAYQKAESHYPGIYTMPGFWAQVVPFLSATDRRLVARCFLHQAEWGVDQPRKLDPWGGATIWQWTDHGRCAGVSGNVDMNRTLVAEDRILALAKRTARPQSPKEEAADQAPDPEPGRPKGVPRWVPSQYWELWQKPWDPKAAASAKFRELCPLPRPAGHPCAGEPAHQLPAPGVQPREAAPPARRQAAADPQLVPHAGLEHACRWGQPVPAHAGRCHRLHAADGDRLRDGQVRPDTALSR